ncbi:MAG TPA: VOC family protein [Gemmatimonadales bacterium]|jgi:predicted enzyme related to lactoylglutathione lyase|nr:VOC family protein [Gemmatimonadales bacterium]
MTGLRYSICLLVAGAWIAPLAAQDSAGSTHQAPASSARASKEKVTGIGGFFFRAKDPKALSQWYLTHLGVSITPTSYEESPWQQEAGPTVFAPFPQDTDYFGSPEQQWVINFRVRDLNRMVEQLKTARIAVKLDPKEYPNGRFARIHDPEGNPIELWEPRTPGAGH